MADTYDLDREDRRRRDRDERDERRPRRARRRYDEDRDSNTSKDVSVLGIVALVKGIFALVASLIPCFGMFAIFAGALALILAIAAVLIARNGRQGMGIPVAATVVSGASVAFSLMWLAVLGAMFRGDERASRPTPVPPPPPVFVAPPPQPGPPPPMKANPVPPQPPKKPVDTKLDDDAFQKQLLEDLARDRIKEAIRNGPGIPVTAEKLDADYRTNVVAADLKYKDKVLEVTGKVVRVVRDDNKATITYTLALEADDAARTVDCTFTEQTKHPLAGLDRGHKVKVRGLCTGRADDSVKIKDCVLVK